MRLRHLLEDVDAKQPIIAKIEKPEGWQNHRCHPGRVRRRDGGARATWASRWRSRKCRAFRSRSSGARAESGKFVITATQMLESMIEHPTPDPRRSQRRRERDLRRHDAVMLSAETSAGKYPVEAVRMMARIACETENVLRKQGFPDVWLNGEASIPRNHRGFSLSLGTLAPVSSRSPSEPLRGASAQAACQVSSTGADLCLHFDRSRGPATVDHLTGWIRLFRRIAFHRSDAAGDGSGCWLKPGVLSRAKYRVCSRPAGETAR